MKNIFYFTPVLRRVLSNCVCLSVSSTFYPEMFFLCFERFCHQFFSEIIQIKTNIAIDIFPPIAYLAKFRFSSYGPKCCQPIKQYPTYLKYQKQQVCNTLQYLKENVKDELDILPVDNVKAFFQIDTILLDVCGHACPSYLKQKVCYFFAIS